MFEAAISAQTLQDALESVSVLVDECKIRANEDSFVIRAVDPANVGMVDMSLAKAAFENYSTDGGGIIGVNLSRFENIVNMANSGDIIFMELDEETRKLEIRVDGLSYTLALIDPESLRQEPDIPDLELAANVRISGEYLDRGVTACDMVSDHFTVSVFDREGEDDINDTDVGLQFRSDGDTDDVEYEPNEYIEIMGDPVESMYSLDYMEDMNKAIPRDGEVALEIGDEQPIKIHYEFADSLGSVTYMLAPRLQSE